MNATQYASNGKRDIHGSESEFDIVFENIDAEKWNFPNNKKIVIDYIKACKKGEAKSGGKNKRVGKSSLYRIIGILRLLSEQWARKDFDSMTKEDWDKFYDDMENDKIKINKTKKINPKGKQINRIKSKKTNLKPSTKAKNYKTIRKFLKWRYGNNTHYPEICENWVVTEEKVTKEYLTRAEVEKMVNASTTLKTKCLIMMLFDGGFRIEELANIRWSDLKKDEGKSYYRAEIRGETSKTKKERNVSLWLATDMIDTYKNSLTTKNNIKDNDFIFESNYPALYKTVQRAGESINKPITPHTMRHSSATYYASIIKTYQQFCARYGWTLRSEAPQRYFHKIDDDMVADQTKEHEIARFRTDFEKLQVENKILRERMDKFEKSLARRENVDEVLNELMQTPAFKTLLEKQVKAIARK